MKTRPISAAAIAALLAVSASGVYAYQGQGAASTSQPATVDPAGSDMVMPNQVRASKIIGARVDDRNDDELGKIVDIVLDKGGAADLAVIIGISSFLGLGGKDVAVKMSDIVWENNRLVVDRTKRQLQRAANYHLADR